MSHQDTSSSAVPSHSAKSLFSRLRAGLWGLEDRISVRFQIALGTSILCFVIVVGVALGAARVARQQAEQTSLDDVEGVASALADRLDRAIASRLDTLRMVAAMEPLRAAWTGDRKPLRALLDQVQGAVAGSWVGFVTPDGTVKAGSGGAREGEPAATEPWFAQGLHRVVFTEARPAAAPPSARDRPIVDIALPVKGDGGAVLGVLVLEVGSNWLENLRKRTLDGPAGHHEAQRAASELLTLDARGRVLLGEGVGASPVGRETFADIVNHKRGSFTATAADGGMVTGYAVTAGFGDFPGLDWTVIARLPAGEAFGRAAKVAWTIILLGLGMGVVGILVASLLAGRIARPLRSLAATADRMGRDSTDMLPRVRGSREVVRLSSALRSLMVRLGFAERRSLEAEIRAQDDARKFSHDIAALRALADTDILTRLLNRRSFMGFAADALVHFTRYKREFAILMIDIDHFKRVNDAHGHVAGDTAIRYVASIIAALVRPSDKAARFGGEEFVVLLREVNLDSAVVIADRLRMMVSEAPVRFNANDIPITISVGVAVVEETDRDVQDVIERADLALYAAKASGRDVVLAKPLAPARPRLIA